MERLDIRISDHYIDGSVRLGAYVFCDPGAPETNGFAGLGGILAAAGLAIYTAIMAIGQMWTGFNLAVSMNSTRKHFFVSYYLVIFAGAMIGLGMVGIIGWAEDCFYRGVYQGLSPAVDFLPFLRNYGILTMVVLVMVLGFCGTLLFAVREKGILGSVGGLDDCSFRTPQNYRRCRGRPGFSVWNHWKQDDSSSFGPCRKTHGYFQESYWGGMSGRNLRYTSEAAG